MTSCIGKEKRKHNEEPKVVFGEREYRSVTPIWSMDRRPTLCRSEFSNAPNKSWMDFGTTSVLA